MHGSEHDFVKPNRLPPEIQMIANPLGLVFSANGLNRPPTKSVMDFLLTVPIPCETLRGQPACAAGALSTSREYISVALDDTSVHVFSKDGSHKLKFVDPGGQIVWAHKLVQDFLIVGCMDGTLRAWSIPDRQGTSAK
ncbi:hypothetical protein ANO11243_091630 [Dothideomycetidae sp. 11243]|nr:hypothetical protein ANO11243_091630 [fungal sp. No.11243]